MPHRPDPAAGPYRWPRQPKLKAAIFADGRPAQEIAAAAGVSPVTLSGVLTGRIRLTPNMLERLAGALDVDAADLVDDSQVPA